MSDLSVRAGDEIRTRDSLLGRQVLYQLSYSREEPHQSYHIAVASVIA